MTNLNNLIPANTGWQLTEARAINDNGEIVGYGTVSGRTHGFLLSLPLQITRLHSYGPRYFAVWTNEFSEVLTQALENTEGFVAHWTSGWSERDTNLVYTLEARDFRGTNGWCAITPDQPMAHDATAMDECLGDEHRGSVYESGLLLRNALEERVAERAVRLSRPVEIADSLVPRLRIDQPHLLAPASPTPSTIAVNVFFVKPSTKSGPTRVHVNHSWRHSTFRKPEPANKGYI